MPRYRVEAVLTFDAAALTEGGRRLREMSTAAESVGFSLQEARVEEDPVPDGDADRWKRYAPSGPLPSRVPDPADPGPPIAVRLDDLPLGDLGNQQVDARLLRALLLSDGRVGRWLLDQGIDSDAVEQAFPGTGWSS